MKVNVDKVLERDAKLSELDSRAGMVYGRLSVYLHVFSCQLSSHGNSWFSLTKDSLPKTNKKNQDVFREDSKVDKSAISCFS